MSSTSTAAAVATRPDKRATTRCGRVLVRLPNGATCTFGAVEMVPVPGNMMGQLIGKGGKNLAALKAETGLPRIDVRDKPVPGLELFGSAKQVKAGIKLLQKQLQPRRDSVASSVAASEVSEPGSWDERGVELVDTTDGVTPRT